ncbi:hypothetical protein [Paludisphaera rhizosphaerae]|uniref:hypothetical protein n=1 Tax=Paludisphaera rhizosphaerae TaxID=2711216 RepID=UPI0013EC1405|nr:hypothetical protein [Paludisphaera rhizosphaerae]
MSISCEGRRAARTISTSKTAKAALLGLGLAMGMVAPTEGAVIRGASSRALVLDATGKQIKMPRAGDAFPAGTSPTYVAYRMGPKQAVPDGTPTVSVTPARGGVGPLRLDSVALQSIDAGLAASTSVAVAEPRQKFLVERATTVTLADASTQYWRAAVSAAKDTGDEVGKAVKSVYNSGKSAVENIDDQIVKLLKTTLIAPEAPKVVIAGGLAPSSRKVKAAAQVMEKAQTEAQVHAAAEVLASDVQAAPVPEPSSWLVFAAVSLLGVRLRSRA